MHASSPSLRRSDDRESSRLRRRSSPSYESDRKRQRANSKSPEAIPRSRSYSERSWDREAYENSRRISSQHVSSKRTPSYQAPYRAPYGRGPVASRRYDGGYQGATNGVNGAHNAYQPRASVPVHQPMPQQTSKSRRLYIGNVPYHAGLTDVALLQFFSAMYVAAFRPNKPGEPLPVVSFWLHSDGKFGFMELRGEQEAVNMMQFNGVFLHGRPLRVNRPSDYRPELHNPESMNLVPDVVNIAAVMELCERLGGVVAAPAQLAAIAVSQGPRDPPPATGPQEQVGSFSHPSPTPNQVQPLPLRSQPRMEVVKKAEPVTESPKREEKPNVEPRVATPVQAPVVISLRNLVTDQDLEGDDEEYEEIVSDVQIECGNYGKVEDISIPRTGPWKGTAFVHFQTSEGAKKAIEALRKRVFDRRQILAVGIEGCKTAKEAADRPSSL